MAPTSVSPNSGNMEDVKTWMFEVDVEKRKVNPRASDTVGGLVELHLTDLNSTPHRQENISVFFTRSTLGILDCPQITKKLFCAALRQRLMLCWCKIKKIASLMSAYLHCKYVFTPEFLSGEGNLRPCIQISLELVFRDGELGSGGKLVGPTGVTKLDNLIIFGLDLQRLVDSCGSDVLMEIAENGGAVMKRVRTSDLPSDCGYCPVCSERMDKYDVAIRTPCSHVFHEWCIGKWLCCYSDSCPMCRSVCAVGI